jgi:Asp-tRNA(Asn)/Glu-tRNA(Gln) amidotransferase A subunit family amidase
MLVYAALANVDYPHSPSKSARTLTSSSSGRKGADAAVAAAAAFEAPPLQPLELPRVLLPGLQQAGRRAASWKPLAGLSVGIYREWYTMCDTGVLACVDSAAESLLKLGATLVDIQIPELDLLQARANSAVRLLPLNFLAWRVCAAFDLGMACMRPCVWPRKSMHIEN